MSADFHFSHSAPVSAPSDEIAALREQRDELLATLRQIGTHPVDRAAERSAASLRDIARAALAPHLDADLPRPAAPNAAGLTETQLYRTGYGDGVRAAAKLCDARHDAYIQSWQAREADASRALAEDIRNLQGTAPVVSPAAADAAAHPAIKTWQERMEAHYHAGSSVQLLPSAHFMRQEIADLRACLASAGAGELSYEAIFKLAIAHNVPGNDANILAFARAVAARQDSAAMQFSEQNEHADCR